MIIENCGVKKGKWMTSKNEITQITSAYVQNKIK